MKFSYYCVSTDNIASLTMSCLIYYFRCHFYLQSSTKPVTSFQDMNFPFKESIRTLLCEAVEILSIINISFHFKSLHKTMFSQSVVNILQKKKMESGI